MLGPNYPREQGAKRYLLYFLTTIIRQGKRISRNHSINSGIVDTKDRIFTKYGMRSTHINFMRALLFESLRQGRDGLPSVYKIVNNNNICTIKLIYKDTQVN